MIYDYEDNEGWVSVWVGNFPDYKALDDYLSTQYFDSSRAEEALAGLFLPENRDRPFEKELRELFEGGTFCQFEYDFGLTFDEDFREAEVFDAPTRELTKLLELFSNSGDFLPEAAKLDTGSLPEYNAAVLLYNLRYTGGVEEADHNGAGLRFLGCFPCEL